MKAGMRMMAINNARRNRERMEVGDRMEYGRMGGDEMRRSGGRMEMRGGERMGYDRMEYGRMSMTPYYGGGEPEARFRDRTGREHYDNGRYAPENYGGGNRGGEQRYPYWPIYEREAPEMNRIGFDISSGSRHEMEPPRGDEMSRRRGSDAQRGMAEHHRMPKFDTKTAREWVDSMKGEDGKSGEHWTMEQLKPIMQQRGIDAKPEEFWAIMNALYSDYCKVAKKHNVSTVDFYADMAKAWLDDKDAVEDKVAAYYEYVVKHE